MRTFDQSENNGVLSPSKVDLNTVFSGRERLKTAKVRSNVTLDRTFMSDYDAQSETKSTLDLYSKKYFQNTAANQTLSVNEMTVPKYS